MLFRRTVRTYRVHMLVAGCVGVFLMFFHTPRTTPPHTLVRIVEGSSLGEIAEQLKEQGVVTSVLLVRFATMLVGGATDVKAGTYRFDAPEHVVRVAWRLVHADYGVDPVRVVLREGSTAYEMSQQLIPVIGEEEARRFVSVAQDDDGYLFPDTYYVMPDTSARDIARLLRKTFDERTAELKAQARAAGKDWHDIIIMASIIEEEVRTLEERRMVSGILWNRIEADMPLQVDASFSYLFGKASSEVTLDDIASDSPYNTYQYKGLPPTPITNPGLTAIEAALNPAETNYFFYLSGRDGTTHYARTYDEHLSNKALYID